MVKFITFRCVRCCRGGNRRFGPSDRAGGRPNEYNNYSRNRREDGGYQNGFQDRRNDDWNRGNNRGGFREEERFDPPVRTNDRWPEPDKRDSTQQFGGKWKEDAGGRHIPRGGKFTLPAVFFDIELHIAMFSNLFVCFFFFYSLVIL